MKKFSLPLAIVLPRKTKPGKRVILNLNNYPHWSFFLYNDLKKQYREALRPQLDGWKCDTPCELRFVLHRKDSRMGDRQNVISVQEKFFCDAVTFYGCWADDNDTQIVRTTYETGEIDRENPRVDVFVSPCC